MQHIAFTGLKDPSSTQVLKYSNKNIG